MGKCLGINAFIFGEINQNIAFKFLSTGPAFSTNLRP
jgi:hypothetical protein